MSGSEYHCYPIITVEASKVCIGLSGNSIHIQLLPCTHELYQSTAQHTHSCTYTQHIYTYIHTYLMLSKCSRMLTVVPAHVNYELHALSPFVSLTDKYVVCP